MMQNEQYLLTRKQYRDLTGASRQSVHNRIKNKSLKVRIAEEPVMVERIVLTPEEYQNICQKMQVVMLDTVNEEE
jgi:hypothetical protein